MPLQPSNDPSGGPPTKITVDEHFPKLLANPSLLGILDNAASTIGETYQQLLNQIASEFNSCNDTLQECYISVWRYLNHQLGINGNQINDIFLAVTGDISGQVGTFISGFSPLLQMCFTERDKVCIALQPGEFAMFNNVIPPKPADWHYDVDYAAWSALATPIFVLDSACAVAAGVVFGLQGILQAFNGVAYDPSSWTVSQVQADLAKDAGTEEWKQGMPYTFYKLVDCTNGVPEPTGDKATPVVPENPVTQTGTTNPTGGGPLPPATGGTNATTPPTTITAPTTEPTQPEQTIPNVPCPSGPQPIIVQPQITVNVPPSPTNTGVAVSEPSECGLLNANQKITQAELIDMYLCLIGANLPFVKQYGDAVDEAEDEFQDKVYALPFDVKKGV